MHKIIHKYCSTKVRLDVKCLLQLQKTERNHRRHNYGWASFKGYKKCMGSLWPTLPLGAAALAHTPMQGKYAHVNKQTHNCTHIPTYPHKSSHIHWHRLAAKHVHAHKHSNAYATMNAQAHLRLYTFPRACANTC